MSGAVSMSAGTHAARAGSTPRAEVAHDLRLMNRFELTRCGEPVPLPLPAQRVVAFLALSERPVSRSALAERLWSEGSGAHALGSLRSALWRLRARDVPVVSAPNGELELRPDVVVDVRTLVTWSRAQLETAAGDDDLAPARAPGELLPDWYDDWVTLERERLRELRVRALEALCERLTAAGAYARANEVVRAAIRDDPLRESAHRCLVRLHLAEGNDAEAVRAYRFFERLLLDGLGLEPSNQIKGLLAHVMPQ
jgi:DNA-binding SARP family transcriptional activator